MSITGILASWRAALLLLGAIIAIAAVAIAWPRLAVRLLKALWPSIVWEVPTDQALIALTFDDGPDHAQTGRVLDILRTHGIKATFFLVGERARAHPEIVWRIVREGHEIGNHSNSYRRTVQLSLQEFESDLQQAEAILQTYQPVVNLFRPASILARREQREALKRRGYTCVLGSSYAFDPARPPVRFIEWAIKRDLRPGSIIVLHDSGGERENTIAALPRIIHAGQQKGLRFVTVSALLAARATGSRTRRP